MSLKLTPTPPSPPSCTTRAMALQPHFDAGFPPWLRSVDFRRRNQLGDIGALPGVPGAHGDGIARAIGKISLGGKARSPGSAPCLEILLQAVSGTTRASRIICYCILAPQKPYPAT